MIHIRLQGVYDGEGPEEWTAKPTDKSTRYMTAVPLGHVLIIIVCHYNEKKVLYKHEMV